MKTPILGICLGMHLMTENSQEGEGIKGLSWVKANTIKNNAHPYELMRLANYTFKQYKERQNAKK